MNQLPALDARGELAFAGVSDPHEVRAAIVALQRHLESLSGEKLELPIEHEFTAGLYLRRLRIPKGTLLVGKIHKQACVNVVESGDISVLTETGSKRITAGFTIISPANLQKVGYAHEDTIFTNIFRTDETDPAKLEKELIWESYEAMEQLASVPELLLIKEG